MVEQDSLAVVKATNCSEKWYKDGVQFGCTQCGKCCTGRPGYTWVTLDEIETIAKQLNLPINDFVQRYLRKVEGNWSLLETTENFDCIFLKDKKCSIYAVRPSQCKTFPFWQKNLASKEAWEQASQFCEGINQEAPNIPLDEIERALEIEH